jgi:hypothetical protein
MFESNYSPLVSYLFENLNQEVQYIRAEMHEAEQFLDRKQIDEDEENERQYREQMERLELWGEIEQIEEPKHWPEVPNPASEWTPIISPQPVTRKCVKIGGVN